MMNVVSKLESIGMFAPWVRIIKGDNRREQVQYIIKKYRSAIISLCDILGIWDASAKSVVTLWGKYQGQCKLWNRQKDSGLNTKMKKKRRKSFMKDKKKEMPKN